jgi:hypothetical protein
MRNAYTRGMKETDWRKTLEVVVKGLVGAVLALAGLWLLGWLFTFIGGVLLGLAGIIGALLRFLIPVAAIAGIVYFVLAQVRPKDPIYSTPSNTPNDSSRETSSTSEPSVETSSVAQPDTETATVTPVEPSVENLVEITSSEIGSNDVNAATAEASSEITEEPSADADQPKKSRRKSS